MQQDPFSSRSFNPADHPILAELVEKPRRRRNLGPIISAIAMVGIVVTGIVLFAVWFIPKEIQQWRIASAEEKRLDGDIQGAFKQLDQDIAKNPQDIELRRRRA